MLLLFAQARGGMIDWRSDHDPAFREARASHRPVLIYFTADW